MSAIVGVYYIRMEIWFINNKESSVGNGGTSIDKKVSTKLCQKLNIFVNSKSGSKLNSKSNIRDRVNVGSSGPPRKQMLTTQLKALKQNSKPHPVRRKGERGNSNNNNNNNNKGVGLADKGNINGRKCFSNINRLRKYSKRYEVLLLLVCLTVFVGIHSYSAVDLCRPRLYCLNETNLSLKEKEYDRLEPFRVANIVLLEIHNVLYKFIIPQHHNRKILVKLLYHFALVLYQLYYQINQLFFLQMNVYHDLKRHHHSNILQLCGVI